MTSRARARPSARATGATAPSACTAERRRLRRREPLVDEDLGVRRMIDDQQRHVVEEVRLPQLRGDAHVVARRRAARAGRRAIRTQSSVCVTPAVSCALMRRPSGDRHRKSVTKPMRWPSYANTHGHDPFSRCSATIASSTPTPNSACGDAVRPDDARDVDRRCACRGRSAAAPPVSTCFCDEQAGAHLDLAADAERVDALVAGVLLRARADHLPVIAGRALAKPPRRRGRRPRRPDRAGRRR